MKKILLGLIGLLFAIPSFASNNLPSEYTELQYIESTGTQYIDTGNARGSSNFVVEYDINMVTAKGARFAFAGASWNVSSYLAFDTSDNTFDVGQGKTERVQGALNTRYTLKAEYKVGSIVLSLYDNNETLLASTTRTSNTWGSSSTASWLFGTVRDIPSGTSFSYTLKSFGGKIWQGTTLVRNFVPAKNSSGVVGMYDTVSGNFFTNAGTGTFTAGPEVQIKIATTAYNSARFSPVVTELNDTIATIRSVVTNTINQTKAIADLQATKQTRPDETCPAGKKCLLVEDDDGTPHWFEIVESAD